MPIVTLNRDRLFARLGQTFASDDDFQDLCFDFGIELDDVTSEREMIRKQKGDAAIATDNLDDSVLYKLDIPANRYDLLCMEGIARALRIFLEKENAPTYNLVVPPQDQRVQIRVKPATKQVRQYVVGAILRDVNMTQEVYDSFLDLQDQLHRNVCRKRTLVAIGTHDLDKIQGPFRYDAKAPKDIKFQALKETEEMTAEELFAAYKSRPVCPLKPYLSIIQDSPVFPVIYDANDAVLSLPPIINGDRSKMTLATRNVLIECTATDLTRAKIVVNTLCAMFSEHCKEAFTVEAVDIVYEGDNERTELSPCLESTEFRTTVEFINKGNGTDIDPETTCKLLNKMQLPSEHVGDGALLVRAPVTRSDIIHPVDIQEDVAIAFGYNNIEFTKPKRQTTGKPLPINHLGDFMRQACAEAGFTEALTWTLLSEKDNFTLLRRENDGSAVRIGKAAFAEFEMCRTTMLPGLLRALQSSVGRVPLPLRLFECGDVVLRDDAEETGARNRRKLGAIFCGKSAGFEIIHALADRILQLNRVTFRASNDTSAPPSDLNSVYSLQESHSPTFFPGRQANIVRNGQVVGQFGILHPEVARDFKIPQDVLVSALEMDIEAFL